MTRAGEPIKVSVVVPVWNPGPNIQRCIDGLLAQTMPADEYELVFVDDGSTDGTGRLLDELAAATRALHVEVVHIPNSGWPGRPRNVGVAAARGEFVHFVDNDDTLTPSALADMYEFGARCSADVIIGKPASDFRSMTHSVYRQNVVGTTLAQSPWLVETLTPHKMFRRALLDEHGIQHPEGPIPFEDQLFVMQAYVHARSIAVLADRACYRYLRRIGSGRHAGDRRLDPERHCDAIARIVAVVDEHVTDPAVRVRVLRRFYRTGVVGPVVGRGMIDWDDAFRQRFVRRVRTLGAERFGPEVHSASGAAIRAPGRLLQADDVPGLVTLAQRFDRIALPVQVATPQWRDGALRLDLGGVLHIGGEVLRCDRVRNGWALPATLAPSVPVDDRMLDDIRNDADVELSVVSRLDHVSFPLVQGLHMAVDDAGAIRLGGAVSLDPMTAMGGAPLTDGVWDLRIRLSFAGFNRASAVRRAPESTADLVPAVTRRGTTVLPYWTAGRPALSLDIGQWNRSIAGALASRTTLTRGAHRSLVLRAPLVSAPGSALPNATLFFRPVDGTRGGLVAARTIVDWVAPEVLSFAASPQLPGRGTWRVWWSVADTAAPAAVELPWLVRRSSRELVIRRVD